MGVQSRWIYILRGKYSVWLNFKIKIPQSSAKKYMDSIFKTQCFLGKSPKIRRFTGSQLGNLV